MSKSMYNDAQWAWLHERYKEGFFMADLADFAGCSINNLRYHWFRLGLMVPPGKPRILDKDAFNALQDKYD